MEQTVAGSVKSRLRSWVCVATLQTIVFFFRNFFPHIWTFINFPSVADFCFSEMFSRILLLVLAVNGEGGAGNIPEELNKAGGTSSFCHRHHHMQAHLCCVTWWQWPALKRLCQEKDLSLFLPQQMRHLQR